MALIKPAKLAAINVMYSMAFEQGRRRAPQDWKDIASEFTSDGESNMYPFMLDIGGMEKWEKEKNFEDLAAAGYELVNEEWQKSVEVKREKIRDDKAGLYKGKIEQLGYVGEDLPNRMVVYLLQNGKTLKCWDDKAYFATNHECNPNKPGLGTVSNLRTAKPLTEANARDLWSLFLQQPGSDGQPKGLPPDTVFVHPDEYFDALEIFNAAFISGISSSSPGSRENVMAKVEKIQVKQLKRSTESGVWYYASTMAGGAINNPLIVQVREAAHLVTPPAYSAAEYNRRVLQWSVESSHGFGYGKFDQLWRMEPT
ncbi:MAG: hypothetical protein E6R03_04775 [Hyphomicrobiaceae bacterium]|nr:MAG: hypothetical protein E6R03_04775 [Hyphomicrobiaceae bacterium]